jgi:hypothetical protein
VAYDDNGLAVFDRIRYRRHDGKVFLYAFELNGDDLRHAASPRRKAPPSTATERREVSQQRLNTKA